MFKIITTIWIIIWPPARYRARAAEAARQKAEIEARKRAEIAAEKKKQSEAEALCLRAYEAHVEAVDLNGIATRRGVPLSLSEISEEVENRRKLAVAAKRDLRIELADTMSDEDITALVGKLDQTALEWLWNHREPEDQRKAAVAIRRARADLDEVMVLDRYVMIVAEAIARSQATMRPGRILVAVIVRAILLRSADPRWTRMHHNKLRPLTEVPYG
jgi:ABC-type transporter Mla MlaB component